MTNQQTHKHDAGITDVLGSMMGLAAASTRFTWRQMQNAAGMFTGSQEALNKVRDSIEDVRHAMSGTNGHASQRADMRGTEPRPAEEAFTGRKH